MSLRRRTTRNKLANSWERMTCLLQTVQRDSSPPHSALRISRYFSGSSFIFRFEKIRRSQAPSGVQTSTSTCWSRLIGVCSTRQVLLSSLPALFEAGEADSESGCDWMV